MSGIVNFVTSFLMSILVYTKNPKSTVNKTFSLFSVAVAHWSLFYFVWLLTTDKNLADLLLRTCMIGVLFMPSLFTHFVLSLTLTRINRFWIVTNYLISFIFAMFVYTSLYARWGGPFLVVPYWAKTGPLFHLAITHFFINIIYSHFLLLKGIIGQRGVLRNQLFYVFLGTSIGYIAGSTNYFSWYRIPIPPFLNIFVSFYVISVAYAIIKHRLMDIELVIKKGLVYSALTAIITGIFLSIILVWERIFVGITGYGSLWVGIIAAFVIAVIFQPLRESIHELVDKYFFRVRYDYQRILNKYSHTLAQPMVNLDRFSRLAPYLLTKSLKLSGSSVAVLDRESHAFIVRAGEKDARELEGITIADDSPLISESLARKKAVSREEIENILKNEDLPESERTRLDQIVSEMERIKTVLVIPCISESTYFNKPTLLAIINLGAKLSEESFSPEDIGFLRTLANQATINVEYAFIFEELQKNQERVVRSEKLAAIGATTAGVAHELKNPLTYLSILSQLLPQKWDDPEFKESVGQNLPSEIQRMQLIVEGLLDYSRTRELMLKSLNIKAVIEKAVVLLNYEIRKSKINLKTDYRHSAMINGDQNRLMQVFMNLMANAVQAMEEKGGDLSIITSDAEGGVRVSISDTGPGIPQDKLKNIFDSFFTTKEAGTGLGLSISKKIIDEHKGSISVESAAGEGTTFTLCLPST